MTTLRDLRVEARAYGIPGRSKLKKNDLIWAIAEVRAAERVKRLHRVQKTGGYADIRDWSDIGNPHKKGRRGRELAQVDDEVDAALRANKYITAVKKKPLLRQKPLRQFADRQLKPHLYGLTRSRKETLARAIKREGPDILKNFLDPDTYYGLVVDNAPVLYPDGSYVKKGDTIVRKEIREDVDGRPFELRPEAKGPDITDDGKIYWVSFENEDLRVTKATGEVVVELSDPQKS